MTAHAEIWGTDCSGMLGHMNASLPPAGWYPDPSGAADERFWDGSNWSQATRRAPAPQPTGTQDPVGSPQQGRPGPHQGAQHPGGFYQQQHQPQPAMRIAGWWWRVLAYIIDGAILYLPLTLLQTWIMGDTWELYLSWVTRVAQGYSDPVPGEFLWAAVISGLVGLLVWFLYRGLLVGWKGGSLGQLVLGMRVIREGDQSLAVPSMGRAFGRTAAFLLMSYVPILGLVNILWPLGNPQRQALHDRMAKTLVLKKN